MGRLAGQVNIAHWCASMCGSANSAFGSSQLVVGSSQLASESSQGEITARVGRFSAPKISCQWLGTSFILAARERERDRKQESHRFELGDDPVTRELFCDFTEFLLLPLLLLFATMIGMMVTSRRKYLANRIE